jgi:hypothetical protein
MDDFVSHCTFSGIADLRDINLSEGTQLLNRPNTLEPPQKITDRCVIGGKLTGQHVSRLKLTSGLSMDQDASSSISANAEHRYSAPLRCSLGGWWLGFPRRWIDVSPLKSNLEEAVQLVKQSTRLEPFYAGTGILPVGIGFLNWGADLTKSIAAIEKYRPCAAWFFWTKVYAG